MANSLSKSGVWPTIAVKDLARARKFYQDVLGYEPMMEDEGGIAYKGKDGTGLLVYPTKEFAGTNKATYATWAVDDLDAEMKDLRSKGVEFEDYDQPGLKTVNGVMSSQQDGKTMKTAWFHDPDGNILNMMQM